MTNLLSPQEWLAQRRGVPNLMKPDEWLKARREKGQNLFPAPKTFAETGELQPETKKLYEDTKAKVSPAEAMYPNLMKQTEGMEDQELLKRLNAPYPKQADTLPQKQGIAGAYYHPLNEPYEEFPIEKSDREAIEAITDPIWEGFEKDYEKIIKPLVTMLEESPGGEGLKQIERGGRELIAPLPDEPEFQLKTATMGRIKKPWLLTLNDVIEITRKKGEAVLRAMNPERGEVRETPSTIQNIYTAYPNMPPEVAASIATIYDIGRDPLFANVLELPMTGIVKIAEFSVKKGVPITKETLPKLYEAFKGGFKEWRASGFYKEGLTPAPPVRISGQAAIPRKGLLQMIKESGGITPESAPRELGIRADELNRMYPGIISKEGKSADYLIRDLENQGWNFKAQDEYEKIQELSNLLQEGKVKQTVDFEMLSDLEVPKYMDLKKQLKREPTAKELKDYINPPKEKSVIPLSEINKNDVYIINGNGQPIKKLNETQKYLYDSYIKAGKTGGIQKQGRTSKYFKESLPKNVGFGDIRKGKDLLNVTAEELPDALSKQIKTAPAEALVEPPLKPTLKPTEATPLNVEGAGGGKIPPKTVLPAGETPKSPISFEPGKTTGGNINEALNNVYTATVNRFNPIEQLSKKAGVLAEGENPAILANRYLGVKGVADSKLFWKTTKLTPEGNLEVTGKGLSEILSPMKNNVDDLSKFMTAQRDIELSERLSATGKPIVGTTPEASKQIITELETKYGKGFFDKTSAEVRDWSRKALLDPLLEIEAISKETYNKIVNSNRFYVPFKRVMDELEATGMIPKAKEIFAPKIIPIKAIKGSEREIINPLESLITENYRITDFVERERVAKSIINLRNKSPELAELIKPMKPTMVPINLGEGQKTFRPSIIAPKNTIAIFNKGKRQYFEVPPDVYKAMTGMNETDVGIITKILSQPAKVLRAGATLTPEFIGRNPIRDQWTAFIFSKKGYNPPVDFTKGIFASLKRNDLYWKYMASGAGQSNFVSLDRVASIKTLQDVLGKSMMQKGIRVVTHPIDALRGLSETGEMGTRLGAFGKALKKGAGDLGAMGEARDITLNFSRRGSQTKALNMMTAFWNANTQGIDKMVRAFKDRPVMTLFKATAGITVPSMILYSINRNDPRYQELPQWQKDLFWIVPVGDTLLRIPKPFTLGLAFGSVPERIAQWIDKEDPKAFDGLTETFLSSVNPVQLPTVAEPIVENITNYSFFRGRPIVPQSKQRLPPEFQASPYNSETIKLIGQKLGISPAKMENLITGYTAGLGQHGLDILDYILEKTSVVNPPPSPTKQLSDYPLIKGFVAREPIGSSSESVNRFYNELEKATQAFNAMKELYKTRNQEGLKQYLSKHPEIKYYPVLNKVSGYISTINQAKQVIYNDRQMSGDEKRKRIDNFDRLMTKVAQKGLSILKPQGNKQQNKYKLSPQEWLAQRKQKYSPQEWLRRRRELHDRR